MPNVLTTKDEVKLHLEDTAGTSTFDALLDAIILAVSQRIELASNRKLFTATRTEIHSGGTPRIYVKCPPITSITSIIYGPGYQFTNGQELSVTEYLVDPSENKNVIYSTYGCFPGGEDSLKVTYVGGYISADTADPDLDEQPSNIPDWLKHAATQQVVYMFKNRKNLGLDNVNIGDGILVKTTQRWFLPEVQDVLKQLRIRNIH
jgi:hypothetical protein